MELLAVLLSRNVFCGVTLTTNQQYHSRWLTHNSMIKHNKTLHYTSEIKPYFLENRPVLNFIIGRKAQVAEDRFILLPSLLEEIS